MGFDLKLLRTFSSSTKKRLREYCKPNRFDLIRYNQPSILPSDFSISILLNSQYLSIFESCMHVFKIRRDEKVIILWFQKNGIRELKKNYKNWSNTRMMGWLLFVFPVTQKKNICVLILFIPSSPVLFILLSIK